MASADIFIGFEEKPKGLEEFLREKRYVKAEIKQKGDVVYEKGDADWPTLFYYDSLREEKEDEIPNWKSAGFNVTSELFIDYTLSSKCIDRAEGLSREIVRRFNGILYDPNLDEYLRRSDV